MWLRAKVEAVQKIKQVKDEAQAILQTRGMHAKRHVNSCEKARSVLQGRVLLSRQRQERQHECRLDLSMFVDDARAVLHKQALVQTCPGLIKEVEKKVKAEDKEKDKERKHMNVDDRFRVEMQEVSVTARGAGGRRRIYRFSNTIVAGVRVL